MTGGEDKRALRLSDLPILGKWGEQDMLAVCEVLGMGDVAGEAEALERRAGRYRVTRGKLLRGLQDTGGDMGLSKTLIASEGTDLLFLCMRCWALGTEH